MKLDYETVGSICIVAGLLVIDILAFSSDWRWGIGLLAVYSILYGIGAYAVDYQERREQSKEEQQTQQEKGKQ